MTIWLADPTLRTVLAGAAILGVTAGVLGSFAVLRRQSLMGDVLAHAALPGLCIGFLAAGARAPSALMAGAFLTGGLAAGAVAVIGRLTRLRTDVALAVVLSLFFAAGVVLLTFVQTRGGGAQAGLTAFLFGQAAAILRADLWVMGTVAAVSLGLLAAFWKEAEAAVFDPDHARVQGLPVAMVEVGLTLMVAVAVVVGLQMVGVVLMTAMLVAPAVAARQWVNRLAPMVLLAAACGVMAGSVGAVLSTLGRGLSTGPLIVLSATLIAVLSLLFAPGRGVLWRALRDRALRRRLEGRRVLATLAALGRAHDDPGYAAEAGMIDTAHGTATARVLARLTEAGLVRRVSRPPKTTPHWELTEAGHRVVGRSGERE
ncbi:MAG: metal ABC transporter permease [Gemmobacter sp.]